MSDPVRILHVDDDPAFADLAATFLERERERFAVDTATSASEGLDRLDATSYDCVVSDYDMPGLSGIELLEAVRERYPDLPFILFTGKGSEGVASDAISAGVTDYLQKGGNSEQYALLANRIENAVSAHRTAQRARLQESLMRHAEVAGGTGGWEVDPVTGDLHCTVGTCRILGVEACEAPTTLDEAIEFYHPDDRSAVRETIERVRATGQEATGEWRLQPTDGKERLVEVTVHPVETDGEVTSLRGAIHDITERRERKRQLREERSFIEAALNTLDDLFYVVDTDGTLRRWNDRLQTVTGRDDDALADTPLTDCVVESDRERLDRAIREALDGDRVQIEVELRTASGGRVPYELTAATLTDSEADVTGVAGVGRQRCEDDGAALAAMAFAHSPDPTALVDVADSTEFHIERVNSAYEALTGLDAETVRGRQPRDVFDGEFGAHIQAQYRNCIEQQSAVEYAECWPVDGTDHEFEVRLEPICRDGHVVAVVATRRDVSEHRGREDDLERYEHLVENLPVGVFRTTPDGEFLSTNGALVDLCGASSEAVLRTAGVEALYADPSHRELLLAQLDEKGHIENKLVRMESLDGESLWVELSLASVEEGGESYIDGVVRDVTDRDRYAPGRLAFELLSDEDSDPLFLVDVDDRLRLQYVDTSHEDAVGNVTDAHTGELARPDGGEGPTLAASQTENLRECIRTGEPRAFEGVSPLTGNPLDGTARVVPVVADGAVEYLVGLLDRESTG